MRRGYKYMKLSKSMKLKATSQALIATAMELIKMGVAKIEEIRERMKPKDPYLLWAQSPDQTQVLVAWKVLKEEDENEDNEGEEEEDIVENLGYIKIDLDAPCGVLREKIRRCLHEPMNKKNGEGFLFLVSHSQFAQTSKHKRAIDGPSFAFDRYAVAESIQSSLTDVRDGKAWP